MEVINRDIFEGRNAIQELLRRKLPVRNSYQVAQVSRKFNEVLKDIDIVRRGLIEKYGTESERGGKEVKEDSENYSKFMAEFDELLNLRITIVVGRIKIPDSTSAVCDKCGHDMDRKFEIEPWILSALYKFVDVL
ncbi:hypothetical protein LCGC14_0527220 [marine sediment metagenome]|uniref:Uncharacterized protein n=1 Tax=marine sediment metagenome TaxID=412755 RepID=A0A0F9V4X7_9ZZZZ